MFEIAEHTDNGMRFIVLQNEAKTAFAKISLDEGASLCELSFNNIEIIKKQPNFDYKDSYASSILFPFASRIANGEYSFKGEKFQLDKNDDDKNALHGLVYNKSFEVLNSKQKTNNCSVSLMYDEERGNKGFPFKYSISLTYTLSNDELLLDITVKNKDQTSFPFIIGWHPYFLTSNIFESTLSFNCDKKVEFNKNLVTKNIIDYNHNGEFKIKNKQLDDCFFLKDGVVEFFTPDYTINIKSSAKDNFLQLYTPPNRSIIAIEPMTGISNSFNNDIGLQVLKPNETYEINWKVNFNQSN